MHLLGLFATILCSAEIGGASPAGACTPPPARIWKLTPGQYDRSVLAVFDKATPLQRRLEDLLPALDERKFRNEADHRDLPLAYVWQLVAHAEQTAAAFMEEPGRLPACVTAKTLASRACLSTALQPLIERAYRRPPTSAELRSMVEYARRRARIHGNRRAFASTLTRLLTSPSFLFRSEIGAAARSETFALDAYERASALSYFLLDGPPDEELRAAAAAGQLDDAAGIEVQAQRLLDDPAAALGLLRFFGEYTQTYAVSSLSKDGKLFPMFDAALAADMEKEVTTFVAHVLKEGGGRLETLLSADYSVISPRLAALYEVPGQFEGWTKVTLPADQRAGLFTQAAFLAAQALSKFGHPVLRGKFIRERFLCGDVPLPKMDVEPLPEPSPKTATSTMRERLEDHTNDVGCRSCHMFMDPLGLPLERYDAIGRYRTHEGKHIIDPSGALHGDGEPVLFKDAVEMARGLAVLPETRACFVTSLFSYTYGRAPAADDACELARLTRSFEGSGGKISELIVEMVTSPSFLYRRRGP